MCPLRPHGARRCECRREHIGGRACRHGLWRGSKPLYASRCIQGGPGEAGTHRSDSMQCALSAVGIFGLQAGEDVNCPDRVKWLVGRLWHEEGFKHGCYVYQCVLTHFACFFYPPRLPVQTFDVVSKCNAFDVTGRAFYWHFKWVAFFLGCDGAANQQSLPIIERRGQNNGRSMTSLFVSRLWIKVDPHYVTALWL